MRSGEQVSVDIVTATRGDLANWRSRIVSIFARLWTSFVQLRNVRRAMMELEAMDDRLLKDIGISRQLIHHAVKHGRQWD